jgi:Rrf2 family transcriptional regulator, cysteine metabolism repressor
MNISSRCDYACRAIVELAHHVSENTPMTATAIAEKRNIPEKYLVHILLQLKKAGLLTSTRGAQGGYKLAQKTSDISLLDIVHAVDGQLMDPPPCSDESSKELEATWRRVTEQLETVLRGTAIEDIVSNANKSNMYFI